MRVGMRAGQCPDVWDGFGVKQLSVGPCKDVPRGIRGWDDLIFKDKGVIINILPLSTKGVSSS